jgi:hypothetical protein
MGRSNSAIQGMSGELLRLALYSADGDVIPESIFGLLIATDWSEVVRP